MRGPQNKESNITHVGSHVSLVIVSAMTISLVIVSTIMNEDSNITYVGSVISCTIDAVNDQQVIPIDLQVFRIDDDFINNQLASLASKLCGPNS